MPYGMLGMPGVGLGMPDAGGPRAFNLLVFFGAYSAGPGEGSGLVVAPFLAKGWKGDVKGGEFCGRELRGSGAAKAPVGRLVCVCWRVQCRGRAEAGI